MKTRICLILAAFMVMFPLVGCQRATETESQASVTVESPPPTSAPPQNTVKLSWVQPCSVEQATSAAKQVFEELDLSGPTDTKTRTVTTRDPKTGRTISRQVPVSGLGSVAVKSDGLSAFVRAKSVTGVDYLISIILMPPESCEISIIATGPNPTDILKKHSVFIQKKISEAIQKQVDISASIPYPKTLMLDSDTNEVYSIVNGWRESNHFTTVATEGPRDGDLYYRQLNCRTASGVQIHFSMTLIDTNKTKLKVDIQGYEAKEDFPMILKSMEDMLKKLQTGNIPEQNVITMEESRIMSPTESSAASSKACQSSAE